jgi:Flp pilus assembly protein TadG
MFLNLKMFHKDSGHALVEFTFTLFVFSLIIFGIFEIASIYSSRYLITYASFMGARCAIVHQKNADESAKDAVNSIIGGTVNASVLVPYLSSVYITTTTKINGGSLTTRVVYKKPISAPVIGRILDPIGSVLEHPVISLASETTIPLER